MPKESLTQDGCVYTCSAVGRFEEITTVSQHGKVKLKIQHLISGSLKALEPHGKSLACALTPVSHFLTDVGFLLAEFVPTPGSAPYPTFGLRIP